MSKRRAIISQEVKDLTSFTDKHITFLEKQGRFPKRFKLGAGKQARNFWWEDEVPAWIAKRAEETRRAA